MSEHNSATPTAVIAPAVTLQRLGVEDADELLAAGLASREHLQPWVWLPETLDAIIELLLAPAETTVRYGVRSKCGGLAGVINLNGILRGAFCNAYLGYYALSPYNGRGLMRAGLAAVIEAAFSPEHELHRLEANIQPDNVRSSRLIKSLGFRLEGHSPNYLKIGGTWCSHDRYALTVEDRPA
jgi:ribosomal-protein-alanine N-acetyltransferase